MRLSEKGTGMNTFRRLARELVIFILGAGFIGGIVGLAIEHRELHPPAVKVDYDALACAAGATNCTPLPPRYQPCPLRTLSMLLNSKPFCVPIENVPTSITSGYKFGVDMTSPKGLRGIVPMENKCAAEGAGYTDDDDADNAALQEYVSKQLRPGESLTPPCMQGIGVNPREFGPDTNPPPAPVSLWKNADAYLIAAGFAAAMGALVGVALWVLYRTVRFAVKG
jgi:hypothetical protein